MNRLIYAVATKKKIYAACMNYDICIEENWYMRAILLLAAGRPTVVDFIGIKVS